MKELKRERSQLMEQKEAQYQKLKEIRDRRNELRIACTNIDTFLQKDPQGKDRKRSRILQRKKTRRKEPEIS